jgi:hypothetical protein
MPRSRSIAIQSERARRRSPRALTSPASWIAPPNSSNFSVSVVLPASGCEMIANVRRRKISSVRVLIDGMVGCLLGSKGKARSRCVVNFGHMRRGHPFANRPMSMPHNPRGTNHYPLLSIARLPFLVAITQQRSPDPRPIPEGTNAITSGGGYGPLGFSIPLAFDLWLRSGWSDKATGGLS